jgi:hypothetical protein
MTIKKLIVVMAIICLQTLDAWAAGPKISFGAETKVLGKVTHGQKITVQFPFVNIGTTTLFIKEIHADYGCTEFFNESPELTPRGRSEIVVILVTAGLSPGRIERHIHVRSNDSERPNITLTLLAEIVRQ